MKRLQAHFASRGQSILYADPARELTTVVARRGKPSLIVSDNGTELTCSAMVAWCKETGID
ncbi:hypothetical protein ACVI1L_004431 [Bradyrhizobium sp. USDA 4516]